MVQDQFQAGLNVNHKTRGIRFPGTLLAQPDDMPDWIVKAIVGHVAIEYGISEIVGWQGLALSRVEDNRHVGQRNGFVDVRVGGRFCTGYGQMVLWTSRRHSLGHFGVIIHAIDALLE